MRRLLLTAAFGTLYTAPLQAQSVDATIDRAVAAYAKMRTARATFEQTLVNPLTGSEMVSRGEYVQQKPHLLAISFTEPKGDRIVADGKAIWIYLPTSNPGQVVKAPLDPETIGSLDLAGQFLAQPRSRYTITDGGAATIGGRRTHALTLVPKQPMAFTRARVWVDSADGTIRQFEVTDGSGLLRRVRLLTLKVNAPMDREAFRFTPPAGVQVFSQPGTR